METKSLHTEQLDDLKTVCCCLSDETVTKVNDQYIDLKNRAVESCQANSECTSSFWSCQNILKLWGNTSISAILLVLYGLKESFCTDWGYDQLLVSLLT